MALAVANRSFAGTHPCEARLLADFDTDHDGAIHDAQLDVYGKRLATASADGHVRLWDLSQPEAPRLEAALGKHAGAVHQVSWADPLMGVLLASAGADGQLIVWGRGMKAGEWRALHAEQLRRHGELLALAWAPPERGAALACASADGTVTVVSHAGAAELEDGSIEHRWSAQPFQAHCGRAHAVAWASPRCEPGAELGMEGARLASAGEDGLRIWAWNSAGRCWAPEELEAMGGPVHDVAWQPWDGVAETLACARGQDVVIWQEEERGRWKELGRAELGEPVWRVSFTELGGLVLVSCGEEAQRSVLLKRRLDGVWDALPVEETGA